MKFPFLEECQCQQPYPATFAHCRHHYPCVVNLDEFVVVLKSYLREVVKAVVVEAAAMLDSYSLGVLVAVVVTLHCCSVDVAGGEDELRHDCRLVGSEDNHNLSMKMIDFEDSDNVS